MLSVAILGAALLAPDGAAKGLVAGLGVGLMVAAVVREDTAQVVDHPQAASQR